MARIPPSDRIKSADGTDSDSADSGGDGGASEQASGSADTEFDRSEPDRDGSTARADAVDDSPEPTRRERTVTETEPETAADPDIPDDTGSSEGSATETTRREETVTETEPEPADDPSIPEATGESQDPDPAATRREETVTETEPEPVEEPEIPEQDSGSEQRDPESTRREETVTETEPDAVDDPDIPDEGTDDPQTADQDQTAKMREQTARASQSIALGTTGLGSETVSKPDDAAVSIRRDDQLEGQVRQEQVEADAKNQVREVVAEQLRDEGANPDNFEISVTETDEGRIQAGAERSEQPDEQFGDLPIYLGGRQVEEVLSDAGETYSETVGDYVDTAVESRANPFTGQLQAEIGEQALREVGADQLANRVERSQQLQGKFTKGFNKGAAELLNAPAVAVGAKEGAEFVGYSSKEVASGDSGELASDVTKAGTQIAASAAKEAAENPVSTVGKAAGGLAGGYATGTAISTATRGTRLSAVGAPGRTAVRAIKKRTPSRDGVSDFIDDTRGQADFGTETKQKTLQRGDEAEADRATTLSEMEEEGIVEVKNRGTSSELSDVEAEARNQLPDAEEYPSRAEFERELTQQMRRIEQRDRADATQDLDTEVQTAAATQQTQTAAALGGLGATAAEATMFAGEQAMETGTVAGTVGKEAETTAVEAVADTDAVTVGILGTKTITEQTTSVTTGLTAETTAVADTKQVADTTGVTDTVQTTETTADQMAVETTLTDQPSRRRRRDIDLGGLESDGERLMEGEPDRTEQQLQYDALDLV